MADSIFILGGDQTDFSRNWAREDAGLFELMQASIQQTLHNTQMDAAQIGVAHIGNFVGELFANQGNLGGFLGYIDDGLIGIPAMRHEGACASGSLAILGAMADLESGRYNTALVTGVELMRNVSGKIAADNLGAAAWAGKETDGRHFVWPSLFSDLAEAYDQRYGLDNAHLHAIARKNFGNAATNPNAQTRNWDFTDGCFDSDDEVNPVVEGWMRRFDCSQITDGAASLILANEQGAADYCASHGKQLEDLPRITGWGHTSAPMMMKTKIDAAPKDDYMFPWLRKAITDAYGRANISGPDALDGIELHDCFTITEYMLIDHFGMTAPGKAWQAIEDGTTARNGKLPVNASGGLIGGGHPVGATGIRMVLDCAKQVTDNAGDTQIDNAKTMATFNVGGSGVTNVSFIVQAA